MLLRPHYRHGSVSSRYSRCPAKPSYSLCSDDQWTDKCPSGCRLDGLIDATETDFHRRLGQVCSQAQTYQSAISSAMLMTTAIYYTHRKIIVKNYVAELRYAERFEDLQRNLTLLQRRSTELSRKLHKIHSLVQQQIIDMRRMEVDIDIKLRACHGSCKHTFVHHIDHDAYTDMESQLAKLNPLTTKKAMFPADIRKLVLQPVLRPPSSHSYRSIPIVRKEFLTQFEDIDLNQIVLEELFNDFDLED
ncbi:fibrinogen alpha chain [Alosa alosa]|uniref:fibrinogen alpha chain n=1 Tax=Alosa alosa TaxID=278164 RepID=UPI0020153341|nr:fibrinogen alpha chain [Alosa alosa]